MENKTQAEIQFRNIVSTSLVQLELQELKNLARNFDPFAGSSPCPTDLTIIETHGLGAFLSNPFVFSNELLKRIDKLENSLNLYES